MWSFIGELLDLLDWIWHWRFSVCFLLGVILAIAVEGSIANEPIRWIVCGTIVIAGTVTGWRWDTAHRD